MERVCRSLRRVEDGVVGHADRPPERYVHKRYADDGMVRVQMQLLPDEADLLFKALYQQKALLRAERKAQDDQEPQPQHAADLPAESSAAPQTLADAVVALAEYRLAPPSEDQARPASERRQLLVQLREERLQAAFQAELHDGTPLSGEALLRIACDADLVVAKTDDEGKVIDLGRKRRTVSPALARALRIQNRTCSFPGCACDLYLQAHHIEHWAQGGETCIDNATLLCHAHHVAIHEGGFRLERQSDGELCFFDPLGLPIPTAPTPPALRGNALLALAREQQVAAIHIDRRTSLPSWDGTPLDLPLAVIALVRRGERTMP